MAIRQYPGIQKKNISLTARTPQEKLGDETWDKMNESLTGLTKDSLPDDLAKAKSYLQGHKDLEEKFDAIYSNMGPETVAYARDVCAGDR